MTKKYLIKSHLKKEVIDYLSKDNPYLMDVDIIDINQYINKYIELPDVYSQYARLKDYKIINPKQDLETFKELLKYKKLFNEFNVDYHTLDILDEIKECLDDLLEYPYQAFFDIQDELKDFYILDCNYDSFEMKVVDHLLDRGAKMFSFPDTRDLKYQYYKASLTPRHEIETLIQYIIQNEDINLDNAIIYYCDSANLDLYETVLKRYNISYHLKSRTNKLVDKYIALYNFYKNSSLENYLAIVNLNIFTKATFELNEYIKKHMHKDDILKELKVLNEETYYQNLYIKAKDNHDIIYPKLIELLKIKDVKELIIAIYDLIKGDNEETMAIKRYIENNYDSLNENNLNIFINELSNLNIKDRQEGIKLVPIDQDYYHYKYSFVLDASSNDFFKMEKYDGLINEISLSDTSLPNTTERYNLALEHLKFLEKSNTIYFSNLTSLEGKEKEASTLIENYPSLDFEMIENDYFIKKDHNLSEEDIKKYLLKDNKIYASVSSLEKYQSCHYAYYLNYILKLYTPKTIELNAAYVGTLLHSVFESLLKKYHKDYYDVSDESLNTLLDEKMSDLYHLYPNNQMEIKVIKELFIDALKLELNFLKDYETSNNYIPTHFEYKFDLDYLTNLHLKGSIDRIDESESFYQIIDYKTSEHNISLKNIEKGLQLQLITYFLIYALNTNKHGEGLYYLNINHKREDKNYYSVKRDGLKYDESNEGEKFINNHRLAGLFINEFDQVKSDYIKIPSSKALKNIKIDELKESNEIILSKICEKILSGDISINPTKDACTYCPYQIICNYKDKEFEREDLYKFDVEVSDEQ